MWKILGVLAFCGLLSPADGTIPGISVALSDDEMSQAFKETLTQDDLLANHLKGLTLLDIKYGNVVGLSIVNVNLPAVKVVLLDGAAEVNLYINLIITGDALLKRPSGLLSISVDLHVRLIYRLENFLDSELDMKVFECAILFEAVDTKLYGDVLPPLLRTPLQQSLVTDLQQQICNILPIVFDQVEQIWTDGINEVISLGPYGNVMFQLAELPWITPKYLGINILVSFQLSESGIIISIPKSAATIEVPSLDGHDYCVAFHPEVFNILLRVFVPKLPLELSNSPAVFSKAEELKKAIVALLPLWVLPDLPTHDFHLKIIIRASPRIVFDKNGSTVTLLLDVGVLAKKKDESQLSVAVLRCIVSLKATFSLVDAKLTVNLSLSKNVISLVTSGAGILHLAGLQAPINNLIEEIVLPAFNEPLSYGLPLPEFLGLPLVNVAIKMVGNALVICK
ncbi:BPI fold-containing family B member 4 isoform X2 [Anolis carolinensis]|uniref:BPI fold-containing family B member 4 isoform X2 n=1 Tax=Anolis carolinensis TaxID=28377 RepID=UPI0007DB7C8B|nr:PREDICTED: BPI fold-containing family B member 4 isoform X2 [Anolis carolinensis]|eukprot:XP_016853782.1 PREDICTED: BPI fold-containing family B member 4 isoform X2 [Anolis carolinensis]